MSGSRPAVVIIILLLVACIVLLAKCVSLVRDKTELEQELQEIRWEMDDRLSSVRDFEGHALTLLAEHMLPILLSGTDENLEGNITVSELVQHAGRGGKVDIKDAVSYVPVVIHRKMGPFVEKDLKSHGIAYYLTAGPIGRPFLEAGDTRGYNACLSDVQCSLVTGNARDGNVILMLFREEYGVRPNSRLPLPPMPLVP
ncbi:MAG: hypothetical protein QF415_00535 [Candidatus Undinarchaeales archaeon]|jgi:hypothetical protein|nr:hypothetical protein [Candidatus Undinarchaeales archaeon]MDP7492107.1 hypothetical protein [Candidatus Undinarchaeales archaeon]